MGEPLQSDNADLPEQCRQDPRHEGSGSNGQGQQHLADPGVSRDRRCTHEASGGPDLLDSLLAADALICPESRSC